MTVATTAMTIGLLIAVPFSTGAQAQTRLQTWPDGGRHELSLVADVNLVEPDGSDPDALRLLTDEGPFDEFTTFRSMLAGRFGVGGRFSRYLSALVAVEGDLSVDPGLALHERVEFSCPQPELCLVRPAQLASADLTGIHYGAGVRIGLTRRAVMPIVTAGLGGVTYTGDGLSESRLSVRVGGGVQMDLRRTVARIEVVDLIVPNHIATSDVVHDVRLRLGVGVRW